MSQGNGHVSPDGAVNSEDVERARAAVHAIVADVKAGHHEPARDAHSISTRRPTATLPGRRTASPGNCTSAWA